MSEHDIVHQLACRLCALDLATDPMSRRTRRTLESDSRAEGEAPGNPGAVAPSASIEQEGIPVRVEPVDLELAGHTGGASTPLSEVAERATGGSTTSVSSERGSAPGNSLTGGAAQAAEGLGAVRHSSPEGTSGDSEVTRPGNPARRAHPDDLTREEEDALFARLLARASLIQEESAGEPSNLASRLRRAVTSTSTHTEAATSNAQQGARRTRARGEGLDFDSPVESMGSSPGYTPGSPVWGNLPDRLAPVCDRPPTPRPASPPRETAEEIVARRAREQESIRRDRLRMQLQYAAEESRRGMGIREPIDVDRVVEYFLGAPSAVPAQTQTRGSSSSSAAGARVSVPDLLTQNLQDKIVALERKLATERRNVQRSAEFSMVMKSMIEMMPTYNGDTIDVAGYIRFKVKAEEFFRSTALDPRQAVEFIGSRLTDTASQWWRDVQVQFFSQTPQNGYMREFICQFAARFESKNAPMVIAAELSRIRMRDRDVSGYNKQFNQILNLLPPSERWPVPVVCGMYMCGLTPELEAKIWPKVGQFSTLDGIMGEVMKMDNPTWRPSNLTSMATDPTFAAVHFPPSNTLRSTAHVAIPKGLEPKRPLVCYKCNKPGHKQVECPQNRSGGGVKRPGPNEPSSSKKKLRTKRGSAAGSSTSGAGAGSSRVRVLVSDTVAHRASSPVPEIATNDRTNATFIIDSGASHHIIGSDARGPLRVSAKEGGRSVKIQIADGQVVAGMEGNPVPCTSVSDSRACSVHEAGDPQCNKDTCGLNKEIVLFNPVISDKVPRSLLSVDALNKGGMDVHFWASGQVTGEQDGSVVLSTPATRSNLRVIKLRRLDWHVQDEEGRSGAPACIAFSAEVSHQDLQRLHEALGHPGRKKFEVLVAELKGKGNVTAIQKFKCEACSLAKACKRITWTAGADHNILEVVHSDIMGPMAKPSLGGAKYILNFTDDKTKFCMSYLLKDKSAETVVECFKEYVPAVERITGSKVQRLRSDQGSEFVNAAMHEYCTRAGISQEFSNTYSPHQNGTAERMNRTLLEMVRTMLVASKLPLDLWGELHHLAVYLYNRRPHSSLQHQSPASLFFPKGDSRVKLEMKWLHPVGSAIVATQTGTKRRKLVSRAVLGYYVGMAQGQPGVRYWVPDQNIVDVSGFFTVDTEQRYIPQDGTSPPLSAELKTEHRVDAIVDEKVEKGRVWYRVRWHGWTEKHDTWEPRANLEDCVALDKWEGIAEEIVNACIADLAPQTPDNVHVALRGKDSALWWEAMEKEYKAIEEQGTFVVVPRPKNRKVIGATWVLRIKPGPPPLYKARLCARGFTQLPGMDYDETYAPTVSRTALRAVLALAVVNDMLIHVVDCKNAFLNGSIDRDIYLEQPQYMTAPGTTKDSHVWKLVKALYGLKQSPLIWNLTLDKALRDAGFKRLHYEPCIYVRCLGKAEIGKMDPSMVILAVYVDDITIAAKTEAGLTWAKKAISDIFQIKDEGAASKIIGIELKRLDKGLILHQADYLGQVLSRFGLETAKSVTTPMENGGRMRPKEEGEPCMGSSLYRQQIGALLYAATCVRPDLCIAVNICSRFVEEPAERHYMALKRILRYVAGTKDLGLRYVPDGKPLTITGFCDSDFAGDVLDSKSTSGFLVMVNGCPVSWKSTKQKCTATSTVEAEYIACSLACKEVLWLKYLLEEMLGHALDKVPTLFVDNSGAWSLAHNNSITDKLRHIRVGYHFVRECINDGNLELLRIPTDKNPADMMTKPLERMKLKGHVERIHMVSAETAV